jgi:hypothetical protein
MGERGRPNARLERLKLRAQASSTILSIVSPVVTAVAFVFWGTYVTDALHEPNTGVVQALADVGWKNLWLVAGLLGGTVVVVLPLWRARDASRAFSARAQPMLQRILELTLNTAQPMYPTAPLSGRYFRHDTRNGSDVLIRMDEIYVRGEPMPDEFGLDVVYVDTAKLVICSSFLSGSLEYLDLPGDHAAHYEGNIKGKVDPTQNWVLACPVRAKGELEVKPLGVLCLYGTVAPSQDPTGVKPLKQIAADLAEVFGQTLAAYAAANEIGGAG